MAYTGGMQPTLDPRNTIESVNYPYTAYPNRKANLGNSMVLITATVGAASVLLFLACVMNHQEAWPAAVGSLSLAAMGASLGFFITRTR